MYPYHTKGEMTMRLEVNSISKTYDKSIVLKDVNFILTPGIYGLLGANGAGKSTLMKIMCGIIKSDKGSINFNDKNIFNDFENFHDNLGFLPQDFKYYTDFTGFKFMMYMAALKGIDSKLSKNKCNDLLKMVGLDEVKNRKIIKYSGGMKQRLGIAQAMLNDPSILILDEPTVGLDPKERISFRNLISSFADNKIVILSTHIVSDVEYIADEILVLKKGCLINRGTALELIKEVKDMVWECSVSQRDINDFMSKYIISNQKHESDSNVLLRIVSETKPNKNAIQVPPTLEDLYLFYFREENKNVINYSL